jgi:SAM-dependent methyltransferase
MTNDLSSSAAAPAGSDRRKARIKEHADAFARDRLQWKTRSGYFHQRDVSCLRFLIPEGKKVFDLGCGPGDLLAGLKPEVGVGVDLSGEMVRQAKERHPELQFFEGDAESADFLASLDGTPFDYIVLSDTIGFLQDCQATLEALHALCDRETRIVISYYSHAWQPILSLAEALRLKMPQIEHNFIPRRDIRHFLELADFDIVKHTRQILVPARLLGLGVLLNRLAGYLPFFRPLMIRNYTVARSLRHAPYDPQSVSIVIPCRNERGNIESGLKRLPEFGAKQEVIFIEGHSQDGTFEEIERVAADYKGPATIKYARQTGTGKGNAVRDGFDMATGDIVMILDADLTVPPEDLPKFYQALVAGKGNLINGSRLVYPMENDAMRFLNYIANQTFSRIFSLLLGQRISDTLCGTKVLTRQHYRRIAEGRAYFSDFDPFGDFDLLFGASKQNFRIIDIPIRYASRDYGETQISRFRHGWLLLRMVWFAMRKLTPE